MLVLQIDLASVQAAVWAFQEQHSIAEDTMPTNQQMISADRQDLVAAIARVGGIKRLADSMRLHRSHRTFAHPTFALAAEDLKKFARQHQFDQNKAPTYATLRQAGRNDLIASYKKYGQTAVVEAAGMSPNIGVLRRGKSKNSAVRIPFNCIGCKLLFSELSRQVCHMPHDMPVHVVGFLCMCSCAFVLLLCTLQFHNLIGCMIG